jgi:hypothetical protein
MFMDNKSTLLEYVIEHPSTEDMREVFLYMDVALKYIHDHNYCIEVFHPSKIYIIDDKPNYVEFSSIMELPKDSLKSQAYIQKDIFNSSFLQIALYTRIGDYLKPNFLIDHFDEVAMFLPEGDVPYYRGVIQRNANVYLSEYVAEKTNRDLRQLGQELDDKSITDEYSDEVEVLSNDKVNDKIYKQINADKAFISFVLIPVILLLSGILFTILRYLTIIH